MRHRRWARGWVRHIRPSSISVPAKPASQPPPVCGPWRVSPNSAHSPTHLRSRKPSSSDRPYQRRSTALRRLSRDLVEGKRAKTWRPGFARKKHRIPDEGPYSKADQGLDPIFVASLAPGRGARPRKKCVLSITEPGITIDYALECQMDCLKRAVFEN